ncbi:MAG: flagellar hook-length control protein FliK [Betaproteobacteria bacterium]|nr:flagellar hook-length control protein FliK [Betaproteobacteria bacterium]
MPQHDLPAPALPEALASTALPTPEATAGVPDAAPALVRQQLDVLETGQILWRGDLWQGQPATIEIAEDEAGTDPGQAAVWRTRLALTLPGLGAFEARLALSGQRLHLHLVAADATGATALRDALPALAAALAARALDLAPVRLHHGLRR